MPSSEGIFNFNFKRFVTFYFITAICLSVAIFLLLFLGFYIPAVREAAAVDSFTPGISFFLVSYVLFSCLSGPIASIPIAFVLELVLSNRKKPLMSRSHPNSPK